MRRSLVYVLALLSTAALSSCAVDGPTQGGSPGSPARAVAPPPRDVAMPARDAAAIDAEVARIFASGQFGTMPPATVQGRSNNKAIAEVETENQTPYVLTVLYSGPTSQRLTMKPNEKGTVKLGVGTYRVAAQVETAARVRPFAGEQRFDSRGYSSRYFIGPPDR